MLCWDNGTIACLCVAVCVPTHELKQATVWVTNDVCKSHGVFRVIHPKEVEWKGSGGVVNGLNDDWSNKNCCSPCLHSLQHSLNPTGGGSGQKYARLGQWQLERFFKSGSNQLLIINTVSRVI